MDLNNFTLIGRLVNDVEIKYTQSGVAVGRLTIANNQKIKKNGQFVDNTSFFDISIFGKTAESLNQYLTKGKQIAVNGTFRQDKWQDQSGVNHSKISLLASQIQLLGGGANGTIQNCYNQNGYIQPQNNAMPPQQQQQQPQQYQQTQQAQNTAANYDFDYFPEDIPF